VRRLPTGWLMALVVLIWGTTWHAIVYQINHSTPELGVTLRFGLAGLGVLGLAAWNGQTLRLPLRAHAVLALQGLFMYSLSYLCVYHAEKHVPSGLVAVGYSASPLLAGLGAWALWRTSLTPRFVAGGVCGVLGVALIFWPELGSASARATAALGLAFTVGAVLLSAVGALVASRNHRQAMGFWPALGYGLVYGALGSAVVLVVMQQPLRLPTVPSWWLAMAYLSGAGTVVAFAGFLTLQQRLGPGKAASVGVMTPVVALAVSTALEGYRPEALTFAGAALAILGNVLMLRSAATAKPAATQALG
jgi:drug/metabolite transporter (DMT)-like permease